MKFSEVCDSVKLKLKEMPLEDKILLLKDMFRCPIDYKDGVYYFNTMPSDKVRISDYLQIREHWMSMNEFDRLYNYFKKN
jgi:hypothetical protein